MENTNTNWRSMSDGAIIKAIGTFIRQQRLTQNITQSELSNQANVNRWTINRIESGEAVSLSSLIPILRSLNVLHVFDAFEEREVIDPLERVKIVSKKRQRARRKNEGDQPKSDW